MYDPNILAFRFRIPFEVEIWHVDPCIGGNSDSAGWVIPHLSELQHDRSLAVAEEWKRVFPMKSFDFEWSAIELLTGVWFDIKWQEHRSRTISRGEKALLMRFATNPVDNLRHNACEAMLNGGDRIERLVRLLYRHFLNHHRPWYRHPRWNFRRWRVEIRSLGIAFGRKSGDVEMEW